MAVEKDKKRKGTALLAVMSETCTSCAGSPICEVHCPVDDCINLLYEELPQGGLKPYRVWVDNDKCIGCQLCYSDNYTKVHRHKETGALYYEYGNKFYDESRKLVEADAMPKKFDLLLVGTESEDRLDMKICPWDSIQMYEFDDGIEASLYFYDPADIKRVDGLYVIDQKGKEKLEEKQAELMKS